MSKYILSCCSTADLTAEHFDRIDVKYVFFHYEIAGEYYPDDLGQSIPFEEFYRRMAAGDITKTSQVNAEEFQEFFRPYLEQGYDILHVTLSSGISGVLNSANIAKDCLSEEFPDRKIYVLDSLCASSGYGMFMEKLAELRDSGMTIDELYDWAKVHRMNVQHWLFTSDLTYLIRGGRVSKAAGMIGSALNICPIIEVDYEGRLTNRAKARGKKKAMAELVNRMEANAEGGTSYSGKCYISHAAALDDAMALSRLVEERFPNLDGKPEINMIGTTIGSHTGPGLIVIFFWGNERVG